MNLLNNLITKLNNGHLQKASTIFVLKNSFCLKVLNFCYNHGLILGFLETKKGIFIFLKVKKGVNCFSKIKLLKKRGLKLFFQYRDKYRLGNLKRDVVLLTTSKGLLTIEEAFKLKIGGEFILMIIV